MQRLASNRQSSSTAVSERHFDARREEIGDYLDPTREPRLIQQRTDGYEVVGEARSTVASSAGEGSNQQGQVNSQQIGRAFGGNGGRGGWRWWLGRLAPGGGSGVVEVAAITAALLLLRAAFRFLGTSPVTLVSSLGLLTTAITSSTPSSSVAGPGGSTESIIATEGAGALQTSAAAAALGSSGVGGVVLLFVAVLPPIVVLVFLLWLDSGKKTEEEEEDEVDGEEGDEVGIEWDGEERGGRSRTGSEEVTVVENNLSGSGNTTSNTLPNVARNNVTRENSANRSTERRRVEEEASSGDESIDGQISSPEISSSSSRPTPEVDPKALARPSSEEGGFRNPFVNGEQPFAYRELAIDDIELDFQPLSYGAFSVVYKGKWRGVHCAIKQLNTPIIDLKAKMEFRKEAAIMQELGHHPNIVTFFGAVTTGNHMWLVTEYAPLGPVNEFLEKYKRMKEEKRNRKYDARVLRRLPPEERGCGTPGSAGVPLRLIVKLAADVALGVSHLHRENVIHRDIAARNVLVRRSGKFGYQAMISDFGLSRVKNGSALTTLSTIGPVKWMAPEAIAAKTYSEKSDAYSFGVLLFEMWTGELPWGDEDALSVAVKVAKERQTLPLPASCDEVLAELMVQCWKHDPAERPTFEQLYNRLNNYAEELAEQWKKEKQKLKRRKKRRSLRRSPKLLPSKRPEGENDYFGPESNEDQENESVTSVERSLHDKQKIIVGTAGVSETTREDAHSDGTSIRNEEKGKDKEDKVEKNGQIEPEEEEEEVDGITDEDEDEDDEEEGEDDNEGAGLGISYVDYNLKAAVDDNVLFDSVGGSGTPHDAFGRNGNGNVGRGGEGEEVGEEGGRRRLAKFLVSSDDNFQRFLG